MDDKYKHERTILEHANWIEGLAKGQHCIKMFVNDAQECIKDSGKYRFLVKQ